MRVSTQVLGAILGITVLSLAVFGGIAYGIARDVSQEAGTRLLAHAVEDIARHWQQQSAGRIPSRVELERLRHELGPVNTWLYLVDDGGKRMAAGYDVPLDLEFPRITERDAVSVGFMEIAAASHTWAAAPLSAPGQFIVLVSDKDTVTQPVTRTLANRLLATGLVVVWVAVWVAVLLSSAIGRRLDEKNDALSHQALHDVLTGLPNRALLKDRMQKTQQMAERNKQGFALLLMDLDRFKEVNDTLGHHVGDQLLQEFSKRIQRSTRESDTISRLGGDEFAVLLPDADEDDVRACLNRIMKYMADHHMVNEVRVDMQASIGVAYYPQHGRNPDELLQHADVAMYQAKRDNSGFAIYNPEEDSHSLRRLKLMGELRTAIEQDQLHLVFQPILDLQSGKVAAIEALSRWDHPQLGPIPPDEFIPIAEQNGLIGQVSLYVIRESSRVVREFADAGYTVRVAVNISTQCLQSSTFPGHLEQITREAGIRSDQIELEITESTLMHDLSRAEYVLGQLHGMGIVLAIDDFGTGFSSLAYLQQLPVSKLKIDRSFVMHLMQNPGDQVIIRSVISLGHHLGCKVVAEGVEDQASLDFLQEIGCDLVQGYFLGRPLSERDLRDYLSKERDAAEGAEASRTLVGI